MSRAGYSEDCDQWSLIRWRGQVASAIRGARGQAFLRELIAALDAMPEKRLVKDVIEEAGNVCAIGSVGLVRGIDMTKLDPEDPEGIAAVFGIAPQMVREIEFMNDEATWRGEPAERWLRMRAWAVDNLKKEEVANGER
jgi:hypothetical protein